MPYHVIKDDEDLFNFIGEFKPDIFVNDCLNSNRDYIVKLKSKVDRVVSIEDLGTGAEEADAVINALYDDEKSASNTFLLSGFSQVSSIFMSPLFVFHFMNRPGRICLK